MLSDEDRARHAERRRLIGEAMGGRGVLVLVAAPERVRSNDTHWPFRQDSDFAYATGFDEPEAVAVVAPAHDVPFAMFVRRRDPEMAVWVGERAGVEGALAAYGAGAAFAIEQLEAELPRWLRGADEVWLPLLRDDAVARRVFDVVRRVVADGPRSGTAPRTFHDVGDVVHPLRLVKAPWEIARLRATIAIAAEAHADAMASVRPGMAEFEIEARIDGLFRRRGATGPAYPSIVASGPHACVLHHTPRDRRLGADELLLIDAGSERDGYCADVTRTFPSARRFSPPQRALYDAVLAAQLAAIAMAKPGETLDALHTKACRVLADALVQIGLLHGSVDEIVERGHYRRFYMHRTSHWLGRDVHDVGPYTRDGAPRPLVPGMVFTVEPGLYVGTEWSDVPDEFRGLGIRIEDDVLVTDAGHEVLTAAAPKQVEEIETLRAAALA